MALEPGKGGSASKVTFFWEYKDAASWEGLRGGLSTDDLGDFLDEVCVDLEPFPLEAELRDGRSGNLRLRTGVEDDDELGILKI